MLDAQVLQRHEATRAALESRWLASQSFGEARSLTGVADGSRPIDQLDHDLTTLVNRGGSLRDNVKQLRSRIDGVVRALDQPKRIADGLRSLSSDLGSLSSLLLVARVVRVIRPVTDRLRSSANALKSRVDAAERKARDLDRRVAPTREKLRKLSQDMKAFLERLEQFLEYSEGARQKISAVRECMENLPQGPARERGFELLDEFALIVQPSVQEVSRGLATADGQVGAVNGALRSIEDRLNQAADRILGGIRSVRDAFGPVLGPLRELARALDRKIDIRIWCFTIRQILDGIRLPPPFRWVEDLFWKAANAILDPILRALRLDISLPNVPGLDLLDGIRLDIPGIEELERLVAEVRQLADNLRNLVDRFDVECPPKEQSVGFSVVLLDELADAELVLLENGE